MAPSNSAGVKHVVKVLRQRLRGMPLTLNEFNFSLQLLSQLRDKGWHRSIRQHHPVDGGGQPIPWYTYPAAEWLAARIRPTDSVFEFGAGHSSVWYGQHAARVVSVDDSAAWLEKVRPLVGKNVELLHRVSMTGTDLSADGDSTYAGTLTEYPPASFDIIVVDGKERVSCAKAAPSRLREGGLIIFDNSDKPKFKPGLDYLHSQGFERIDFSGPVAQVGTLNCTSVFARSWSRWLENIPVVFQGW